jgi:hypothetical protein
MRAEGRAGASSEAEVWLRVSVIVCFLIAALLWAGPDIAREDIFEDDAAHHIFWFYRYADPALFPNDLSLEYFTSGAVAPVGYKALYAVLAPLFDVLEVAEWMSVVLLGATVALAWMIGRALGDGRDGEIKGLLCAVVMIGLLPQSDLLPPMGFQRTFAMPLTLLCLWALVAKRYVWVGVSWILAALFYPIVIAVIGLASTIVFLIDLIRDRRMPDHWIWNGVLGVVALAIVLLFSTTPEAVGPSVSFEQAMAMPEFGPEGRQALFGTDWKNGLFRHHRTGLGWSPWMMLIMVGAVALASILGHRREISAPVVVVGVTGLVLWLAARLTLFDLYLPNRHSRYAIAVLLIVAVAVAGYAVLRTGVGLVSKIFAEPSKRVAQGVAVLAPFIVMGALAPVAWADLQRPVDEDLERTYDFLATLPKQTLIAAHPDLADYIPLRSKRSVLASTEGWIAFMLGYHERTTPRVAASLEAAFATDWESFTAALAPYGVDVFVSSEEVFTKSVYNPPLDSLASELFAQGLREGFALRNPPEEHVLFRSGDYVVVEVSPEGAH